MPAVANARAEPLRLQTLADRPQGQTVRPQRRGAECYPPLLRVGLQHRLPTRPDHAVAVRRRAADVAAPRLLPAPTILHALGDPGALKLGEGGEQAEKQLGHPVPGDRIGAHVRQDQINPPRLEGFHSGQGVERGSKYTIHFSGNYDVPRLEPGEQ